MIKFFVHGRPSPGGSKRYVGHTKATISRASRAVLIDMGGKHTKDWRAAVAQAARLAYSNAPADVPLCLKVTFVIARPKAHYTCRGLRDDAPVWHTNAPDATKLVRSTEDALKGILWVDDRLIATQTVEKRYNDSETYDNQTTGAWIEVICLRP